MEKLELDKRSGVGTHLAHNCSTRVGVSIHVKHSSTTSYRRNLGNSGDNFQVIASIPFNPLAPNDHCTGRYYATPECRMTSTLVTSRRS